jgi:hypothetical protein
MSLALRVHSIDRVSVPGKKERNMTISKEKVPQPPQAENRQSQTARNPTAIDLRLKITPVAPNLENSTKIAEIFPCK